MEKTPTVLVEGQDGEPLRINVEDYNAETHTLIEGEAKSKAAPKTETEKEGDDFDREAAKARLKEAGVDFNSRAKNEVLQGLIAELDAKEAEQTGGNEKVFNVEPKDDKFIIVDGDGSQVGEDVFDTEDDAKAMISLLKGE